MGLCIQLFLELSAAVLLGSQLLLQRPNRLLQLTRTLELALLELPVENEYLLVLLRYLRQVPALNLVALLDYPAEVAVPALQARFQLFDGLQMPLIGILYTGCQLPHPLLDLLLKPPDLPLLALLLLAEFVLQL